jgi:hypothetical protein
MNNHLVYVIVFSYDNKTIADSEFFTSYESAWEHKKAKISNNECLNPITAYSVKTLTLNKGV